MSTKVEVVKSVVRDLPPVIYSPTTAQYKDYRGFNRTKDARKPHFIPRFTFKREDRAVTLRTPAFSKAGVDDPLMPPYPYGANNTFKEANFGLYGGATVQSGNKISKGRNKGKTLRHWFPNVRIENIRSEALGRELRIPITARVMRTIRKCGGLDKYVCGTKPARIKELGLLGWRLRWLVMTSPMMRSTYSTQRARLRLTGEQPLLETFADVWNDPERREKLILEQEVAWKSLKEAADRFENHVQRQWIESGEKQQYRLPKLDTLQSHSPRAFPLMETIPEHSEVETVEVELPLAEEGALKKRGAKKTRSAERSIPKQSSAS